MTPVSIVEEFRDARQDFRRLVDEATTKELRRSSNGTRWTNDQLLFHMLLGYLVIGSLLWLVRGFSNGSGPSGVCTESDNCGRGHLHKQASSHGDPAGAVALS